MHGSDPRLALLTHCFDDPFVTRDGLRHRLLHELLFGVDVGTVTRAPVSPDELLRLSTGSLGIIGFLADRLDVLTAGATRAGNTEVFLFAAPAGDRDFFLFADEAAGLLKGCVVTAAVGATPLVGETSLRREQQRECEQQRSLERCIETNRMSYHGVLLPYQLKSNRVANRSEFVLPNVVWPLVTG